jgi:hypothetical protein
MRTIEGIRVATLSGLLLMTENGRAKDRADADAIGRTLER